MQALLRRRDASIFAEPASSYLDGETFSIEECFASVRARGGVLLGFVREGGDSPEFILRQPGAGGDPLTTGALLILVKRCDVQPMSVQLDADFVAV